MALTPAEQIAQYSERFNRELVIPQLINFDWRPDYETGKGGTTNIQTFLPGVTGTGSDIGASANRLLTSRNVPAVMQQFFSAVSVASLSQTTLVEDFERAVEPTLAAQVFAIESYIKGIISTAVSNVTVLQTGASLPDQVARVIGQVKSNSLESQVNALMSPELMSVMASKLLDKFNAPTPALEAFEGRIRRWQGASDIGQSIAMTGFTTINGLPTSVSITAPAGPVNAIALSAAANGSALIPAGTMSINLGNIGYDPIRGATGQPLIVTNAADIPAGSTSFPLSFTLEAGVTCSAYPAAGAKGVVESAGTTYGEIYVFRKAAVAGRAAALTDHTVGKLNFKPNGGISIRRWQFSEGQEDLETVRFDALLAAAPVYPVGVSKILVPSNWS